MARDESSLLLDVAFAARAVVSHVRGLSRESFLADTRTQDAVLYRLTVLGEAARRVPETVRQRLADIPWISIVGVRNRVVHEYDSVNLLRVWAIATEEVPKLLADIARFLPEEKP